MGPFSLGDWHDDRVCIYDDNTDTAVAWISQAQGRPLPGGLLTLIKAAPELLWAANVALDMLGGDESGPDDDDMHDVWVRLRAAVSQATSKEFPNG